MNKLNEWNSGVARASRALKNGDNDTALRVGAEVIRDYQNYRRRIGKWETAIKIIVLASVVLGAILGLIYGNWRDFIITVVIGAVLSYFLYDKIVVRKIEVANAFSEPCEHLAEAMTQLLGE